MLKILNERIFNLTQSAIIKLANTNLDDIDPLNGINL